MILCEKSEIAASGPLLGRAEGATWRPLAIDIRARSAPTASDFAADGRLPQHIHSVSCLASQSLLPCKLRQIQHLWSVIRGRRFPHLIQLSSTDSKRETAVRACPKSAVLYGYTPFCSLSSAVAPPSGPTQPVLITGSAQTHRGVRPTGECKDEYNCDALSASNS